MSVAVLAFLLLAQRGFIEFLKPDRHHPPLWADARFTVAAVVVVGLSAMWDGLTGAFQRVVAPGRQQSKLDVRHALISAFVTIDKRVTDIDISELGASVFVTRRDGLRREWVLHRVERFRLSDAPHPSKVRFTRGKGIIGTVWANRRPEYVNWQPIAKKWAGKEISERQWSQMRADTRCGFSREDFMALVGKYAEIHAVPIVTGSGRLIGVLALDREAREPLDEAQHLKGKEVERILTETAKVIAPVIPTK